MSLSYWLNAHLCWVMLGLLYFLLLRSTTFYRWNRWYLLGSSLLGLLIPVWSAWMIDDNNFVSTDGWLPEVLVSIERGTSKIPLIARAAFQENKSGWQSWVTLVYAAGIAIHAVIFFRSLLALYCYSRNADKTIDDKHIIFSSKAIKSAFSFFHRIYLPAGLKPEERQTILLHEKAHAKAYHSVDLLFASVLQIFCWFSPLPWLLRKELRLLHEYEADAAAWSILGKKAYGYLVLQHTLKNPAPILTNQFHFVHLQKRFAMLFRSPSAYTSRWRYLMVVPALLLLFSGMQSLYAQKLQNGNDPAIPILKSCLSGSIQEQQLCTQQSIAKHLSERLRYPKVARDAGKSGTVVAQINVNQEGYVSEVKILKSQGWGMDEEVVRVLSNLEPFEPVEQGGQLVNGQLTLPVKFLLEEETPPQFLQVKDFKIAPNPNNGQFDLSFNTWIPTDTIITLDPVTYKESIKVVKHNTEIRIYDFNGKLIYQKRTADENFRQQIQLGNIPKGVYYVLIKQSDGEYVEKMIVE